MEGVYLVFDAGGTKTRVGVAHGGKILRCEDFETSQDFSEWLDVFENKAREILAGDKPILISGGMAGVFDGDEVFYSPNLTDWIHKKPKCEIEKIFDCEVLIKNDAALAGLGEAIYGAGKGFKIVSYFTVSTGVGGTRIVNGKIDESVFGFEPGQMATENDKTLESIISGKAVMKKTGKHPSEVTDDDFWDEEARVLARGLYNAMTLWSPEVFVLGGGMMLKKPGIDFGRVDFYLKKMPMIFPKWPEVRLAELGDLSGIYGALERAENYEKGK